MPVAVNVDSGIALELMTAVSLELEASATAEARLGYEYISGQREGAIKLHFSTTTNTSLCGLLLTPRPPLLVNSVEASKVAKYSRPNSRGEGEPIWLQPYTSLNNTQAQLHLLLGFFVLNLGVQHERILFIM